MADLKTHLRELSVAVTVGLLARNINFTLESLFYSEYFFKAAKQVIKNDISFAEVHEPIKFNVDLCQIIKNGYNLGKKIYNSSEFNINNDPIIIWSGCDTQKDDPVDISINQYLFSLKEDSFILENMGLYKLLNCFTGSTYKKRHIFKDYALIEYKEWFLTAWDEMYKFISQHNNIWILHDSQKSKTSVIKTVDNNIVFEYYLQKYLIHQCVLPQKCSLEIFEESTNSTIREEVFSKFINRVLSNNTDYNNSKRKCAIVATTNIANELTQNLNYNAGISRFLRIHEFCYYYAKTTATDIQIYKVPALSDFKNNIVIDSITSSVPNTQANILTTIKNTKTGMKLVLRNECRFSHGQFNGTPEAKMYYESGGSLLTIYELIN